MSALTDAGLENWVVGSVAGNGFVPGVTSPDQIADPANPCEGAVPREHSHFFDEHGLFGSLERAGDSGVLAGWLRGGLERDGRVSG